MARVATIVLSAACLLAGCSGTEPLPVDGAAVVERSRVSMGSEVRLTAWSDDEAAVLLAFEAAFDEFDRLDRLMSVWIEGSDVQRINAAAGAAPVRVSQETIEVLQLAEQVGGWTQGKFDVSFGALSGLWKFDHDQDNRIPAADDVRARLPLVDHTAIVVDPAASTVLLQRSGMRLHLGGIGKGYAVDRAASLLRGRGIANFIIQAGGDMYAAGRRGERPWRGGIADPRGDEVFAPLDLRDETLSTSGDYERFFLEGGRRYHHILDPDSGEPARASRSVTIIARRAALADALSTGVFVMGPEAGMALVERLEDVEAVIVSAGNDVLISSGLKQRLELRSQPTDGR